MRDEQPARHPRPGHKTPLDGSIASCVRGSVGGSSESSLTHTCPCSKPPGHHRSIASTSGMNRWRETKLRMLCGAGERLTRKGHVWRWHRKEEPSQITPLLPVVWRTDQTRGLLQAPGPVSFSGPGPSATMGNGMGPAPCPLPTLFPITSAVATVISLPNLGGHHCGY